VRLFHTTKPLARQRRRKVQSGRLEVSAQQSDRSVPHRVRSDERGVGCVPARLQQTGDGAMKSQIAKRSIVIDGHKTSVSLEDAFWATLKEIANERGVTLSQLIATIDKERRQGNLSSAIRLFVLGRYRPVAAQERAAA
jgi:predicted DNA-binding ribbon-helix-helix protein